MYEEYGISKETIELVNSSEKEVQEEFKKVVENFINQGGIYIGVSAGSVACSKKYENGLNFIENILNVHCEIGSSIGKVENTDPINLTNNQAILILDDEKVIFE